MRERISDGYIGKYAILKKGYAGGLIGIIKKNDSGLGNMDYIHETESGIRTGIMFLDSLEIVEEIC